MCVCVCFEGLTVVNMAVDMDQGVYDPSFGKRLAATDKKTRDKAVDDLQIWTARLTLEATYLDLQKVWKAIFFCYWHSDKPLVQQELAERIAALQHSFQSSIIGFRFLTVFFEMLVREWHGIDRLRLDKYYNLLRQQMRQSFVVALRENAYEELASLMGEGEGLFGNSALVPEGRTAVRGFMVDILFEELEGAVKEYPQGNPRQLAHHLLRTLINFVAHSVNKFATKRVVDAVFTPLFAAFNELNEESDEDEAPNAIVKLVGDSMPLLTYMRELAESSTLNVSERGRYTLYQLCKEGRKATGSEALQSGVTASNDATQDDDEEDRQAAEQRSISRPRAVPTALKKEVKKKQAANASAKADAKRTISRPVARPTVVKKKKERAFDLVHLVCGTKLNGKGFVKVAQRYSPMAIDTPRQGAIRNLHDDSAGRALLKNDPRVSLMVVSKVTDRPKKVQKNGNASADTAKSPKKSTKGRGKNTPGSIRKEAKGGKAEQTEAGKTGRSAETPTISKQTPTVKRKSLKIDLKTNRAISFMDSLSNLMTNDRPFSPIATPTKGILKSLPKAEDYF